jgi:hypothetical protein
MKVCKGGLESQVVMRRVIMPELCMLRRGGFIYSWRECVKGFHDLKMQASSLVMLAHGMW